MEEKTPKRTPRDNLRPPWKPGESGNPAGRPKGSKNFETYFMEAWKEVAEALRLNKDPDKGKVEILKLGFKEMFKGNYQFWRDFVERLFGKIPTEIDLRGKLEIEKLIEIERKMSRALKEGEEKFKNQNDY